MQNFYQDTSEFKDLIAKMHDLSKAILQRQEMSENAMQQLKALAKEIYVKAVVVDLVQSIGNELQGELGKQLKATKRSLQPIQEEPPIQFSMPYDEVPKVINFSSMIHEKKQDHTEKNSETNVLENVNEKKDTFIFQEKKSTEENTAEEQKKTEEAHVSTITSKDIATIFTINERYLTASKLFKSNMEAFKQALMALNQCKNWNEANHFISKTLAKHYNWDLNNEYVMWFIQKIETRFLKN